MPKPPIPADLEAVLSVANPAIIGTVRPDGQPVTVATWYLYENGRVLVNMDAGRKRLAYLREDPRVSLTVLDGDDWYSHISLQGRIGEFAEDLDLSDIDRLSRHYRDQPYPNRERPRVSAWIDVTSWHGWGRFAAR
jgi:PPOX class probable F420-dependent enzyme